MDDPLMLTVDLFEYDLLIRACDRKDKQSHVLLIFLLRSMKPERYNPHHKAEKKEDGKLTVAEIMAELQADLEAERRAATMEAIRAEKF